MEGQRVYRAVKRMSLAELRYEQELLEPFIRDMITAKQARIRKVQEEIDRREQMAARDAEFADKR